MTRPTVIQVCAFLRRHAPWFRKWKRKNLLSFVQWYWHDARCGVVRANGKIVAVGLARCLDTIDEGKSHYVHKEAGPIVWIQDVVSIHPHGLRVLRMQALQRFGPSRTQVAANFRKHDGAVRTLPYSMILKTRHT